MKHTDPTIRFIKAVDTKTGKIVGQANWLILEKEPTDEQLEGHFWENEDEKEHAQQLFAQFMVPRIEAVKSAKGPLIVLDMLSVDPEYQSSGAGAMLTRWGTELADQMQAEAIVESTMNAVRLYEKNGFRGVEEMKFEFPEKYADKPKPNLLFMRRPAAQG
ncbi:MAG: hypothetical protein Q9187_000745 [Circinaria calcarea]